VTLSFNEQNGEKASEEGRRGTYVVVGVFLVCILVVAGLFHFFWSTPISTGFEFKAAIVDHLSFESPSAATQPNQTFVETVTGLLEQNGYTVDYYEGEKVTVDFYRNLATHNYSLLVLRVHSAVIYGKESLSMFTSEVYGTSKYVPEQLNNELTAGKFRDSPTIYFSIPPPFITNCMGGSFENTTVVMMGCGGLEYETMAEAFIQKRAKVYVSWSGDILPSHTDQATTVLLTHLLSGNQTVQQAVAETNQEAGSDPVYKSTLLYYPLEAGNYTVPTNPTTPEQ